MPPHAPFPSEVEPRECAGEGGEHSANVLIVGVQSESGQTRACIAELTY